MITTTERVRAVVSTRDRLLAERQRLERRIEEVDAEIEDLEADRDQLEDEAQAIDEELKALTASEDEIENEEVVIVITPEMRALEAQARGLTWSEMRHVNKQYAELALRNMIRAADAWGFGEVRP